MRCGLIEVPAVSARLWALWGEAGLQRIEWAAEESDADSALGAGAGDPEPIPEPYGSALAAYLAGEPVELTSLPLDLQGTEFQLKVWRALLTIPRGNVRTYASIANDIGSPRGMRAVGAANGANPIPVVVPCHRVVEAGMRLGGYSGGLHIKRHLLELEGVKLVGDEVHAGQLSLI